MEISVGLKVTWNDNGLTRWDYFELVIRNGQELVLSGFGKTVHIKVEDLKYIEPFGKLPENG